MRIIRKIGISCIKLSVSGVSWFPSHSISSDVASNKFHKMPTLQVVSTAVFEQTANIDSHKRLLWRSCQEGHMFCPPESVLFATEFTP